MNQRQALIKNLCDGKRTSKEIALLLNDNAKYVQRTMLEFDLPRHKRGARKGSLNPSFVAGRRIDKDGYVLVSAPDGHPHARIRKDRNVGIILEHRLVMEKKLGRYLHPLEVVDHIDGLHLHNCPSNLRVFENNAAHLKATIKGKRPLWSKQGFAKLETPHHLRKGLLPVDIYGQRKKLGEIRLQQILLAMLKFDKDSRHLLGTSHHIKKAGIDVSSRSMIQRALDELYSRWE